MRKMFVLLVAGLFLILFFVATTANQIVNTVSDPKVITGMLNDADVYDYIYDNIVANMVHDMVSQGIEVKSGLDESTGPTVLEFDDPDAAALAITDLIENILSREYVKEKFEESLNGLVPYASGETDEFTIDLEVQGRVREIPAAVRGVVSDLDLAERIIEDLLLPQLDQFSEQVSNQALGIQLTDSEQENAVRQIFEPVWLEDQIFAAVDEITPFFAGDAGSFKVVLQFDDRAVVIRQILKDKLVKQDTLYNLVFAQVVDPLIQKTVDNSTDVGFGISLTEAEVVDTFEIIAPKDWVKEQGEGVIDVLINYLVGNSDSINYTVNLSDRKVTAANALKDLARTKLEATVSDIPSCTSPLDVLGASQDIASNQLPRCVGGGQTTIDLTLSTFGPLVDSEVSRFVEGQIPSEVIYTRADLEAQVGGGLDSLDDLRDRITEGFIFTDQDLIEMLSDGTPESRADAEQTVRMLADGVMFTEENITENLDPLALQQFNKIRDYAGTVLGFRWVLWVLVLMPLVIITLISGGGWAGRLKWVGGVAAVSALIVYGGIVVAWSLNDIAQDYAPDYGSLVSSEFRVDYPRLSAELGSDEPNVRFERALGSWQRAWRNQTVPWIIGGLAAFAVGSAMTIMSRKQTVRMAASPSPSSNAFAVSEEWGDDAEEDHKSSGIESAKVEPEDEKKHGDGSTA